LEEDVIIKESDDWLSGGGDTLVTLRCGSGGICPEIQDFDLAFPE
jgi:hypothetical protein